MHAVEMVDLRERVDVVAAILGGHVRRVGDRASVLRGDILLLTPMAFPLRSAAEAREGFAELLGGHHATNGATRSPQPAGKVKDCSSGLLIA